MGCRFADIFQPLTCKVLEETGLLHKYTLDRPRKKNLFLPALYEYCAFDKCFSEFVVGYKDIDFSFLKETHKVWMASCKAFYREEEAHFEMFRPIEELQTQINNVVQQFPAQVIGMQIRRTDHITAIQSSPTACFEAIMEKLDAHTKVYLATDDEHEKQHFVQLFGDRILTRESTLERGSKKGIQDAVIEMYILAATNRIYGSKSSSFGQIAAKIGNIEFIEVQNK